MVVLVLVAVVIFPTVRVGCDDSLVVRYITEIHLLLLIVLSIVVLI